MNEIRKVYLCKNKDQCIWKASSSGGVFYSLAKEFIEKYDGVVYGAAYSENFQVEHKRAESVDELKMLRGSKYVQSKCFDTYVNVLDDLKNNRYVMFSGTACQIDSLLELVGKNKDRLFTIDVLCHGVPSPQIFREYIKFQEENYRDTIKNISFRGKKIKNEVQDMLIEFNSGKKYSSFSTHDIYYNLFLQNLILDHVALSVLMQVNDEFQILPWLIIGVIQLSCPWK